MDLVITVTTTAEHITSTTHVNLLLFFNLSRLLLGSGSTAAAATAATAAATAATTDTSESSLAGSQNLINVLW
jgi:hypothetical protein